jgi:hypothetical protein
MRTLSQILVNSNSYLDLEAALPSGDDLTVRIDYAQQAVREWADSYRWKELSTPTTLVATLTTVSLPTNFRELEGKPKDTYGNFYPELPASERVYQETSDKYSYLEGNQTRGYVLTLNGLSSLATLSLTYQRHPSNMATLTDVCEVPDDQFVVQKIISMVLQSRSDERFPQVEANAQRLLGNMIGRNMVTSPGGDNKTRRTGSSAYAIGRSRG